jgi:hypothetical protein
MAGVNVARLLFYALASFFLGAIAVGLGSAAAIEVALGSRQGRRSLAISHPTANRSAA